MEEKEEPIDCFNDEELMKILLPITDIDVKDEIEPAIHQVCVLTECLNNDFKGAVEDSGRKKNKRSHNLSEKSDKLSVLDAAIDYLKALKLQVDMMYAGRNSQYQAPILPRPSLQIVETSQLIPSFTNTNIPRSGMGIVPDHPGMLCHVWHSGHQRILPSAPLERFQPVYDPRNLPGTSQNPNVPIFSPGLFPNAMYFANQAAGPNPTTVQQQMAVIELEQRSYGPSFTKNR
ncbi:hypothetical protein ACFE04_018624 [Oxalis oulophora]